MEHFPPVADPFEPISVPFIAEEYDNGVFEEYPSRRGLNLERLMEGDSQNMTSEQVASFLQTWLYFGLLHGILGANIMTSDFLRIDNAGKKWITTVNLPAYLYRFRQSIQRENEVPKSAGSRLQLRNSRINTCLRLSQEVWEELNRLPEQSNIPNPLSPKIAFGIHILATTLQVGATEICGGKFGEPTYRKVPWERSRHWRITRNNFIELRMAAQGWCPTVIRQIWTHQNPMGQYYSSLLGPPHRRLDHGDCGFDDKECAAMKRLALGGVNHESKDCQCDILLVDPERLAEIIGRNEIPILSLIEKKGKLALDVLSSRSEPELEYTALSHVWTDGWGNPDQNSLPLCRVQKLVRDISATYSMPDFDIEPSQGKYYRSKKHDDRIFFWMDTLCVPRVPADIYSRAIVQMREVYESAERVLVYDADLMSSTSHAEYEELNMRISNSRWIRRLWTVQEAVLAKRLIFQFADGPQMFMTGSLLWTARNKDLALNYFNSVGWDCNNQFETYGQLEKAFLLNFVWVGLLSNRSVSVASDEAICFSILMDFDLKLLINVPVSERIQYLWTLLGDTVPLATLFVSGPRLTSQGFSWAPASFLDCTNVGPLMKHLCSVTKDGLRVKLRPYTAFSVDPPQVFTDACFPCSLQEKKYFVKRSPVRTNLSWEGLDLRLHSSLAVILEMAVTQEDAGIWSIPGSRAALVSITRKENGILFAKYLRLVSVVQEGSIYHKFPVVPWTPQEISGSAREPSRAKWIEVEQDWCFV